MTGERNQDREGERLAEDDVLPEARVEAEVATFRNSLPPKPERQRPLPGSRLLRKGQKWTVYQSGEGREVVVPFRAQPSPWHPGQRAAQARRNSRFGLGGRWGLPGDVGTDDDWSDEDNDKKQDKA